MERRQAEHFLALCETGTFTAAARSLRISQSALSQSVGALESELNKALFDRSPVGVTLTAAGHRLAPVAADIIRSFDAVGPALATAPTGASGTLRLTCPASLVLDPLLPMLQAFRRAEPAARVDIQDPRTEAELLDSLASGRADAALAAGPLHAPGLVTQPCGHQQIPAVLPPSARPVDDRLPTLLTHGLVCSPRGRTIRRLLEDAVGSVAVARALVVETDQTAVLGSLVQQGVGVAFLPEAEAHRLQEKGLRIVRSRPQLVREVSLVYREGNTSAELRAFRRAITTTPLTTRDEGDSSGTD